jgi:hypothetical protein
MSPDCQRLTLRLEAVEAVERLVVAVEPPRGAQLALDARAVALGQVVEHVALLVANTPLDRSVDAQDVADGLPERLGAVEHHEHALLDVQAAVGEVGEQRGRDRGVLGAAVPQPERDLDPVGGDPEPSTCSPTGSRVRSNRRVEAPASIGSSTSRVSGSRSAKCR